MIRQVSLIMLTMLGLTATTARAAEINEPVGLAINMLSGLQDVSSVNYINGEYLLDDDVVAPSLKEIRTQVLNGNKRYFLDFSNINNEVDKNIAKGKLRHSIGIGLAGDMIIISGHKGELMFSELDGDDDPKIILLEAGPKQLSRSRRSLPQNKITPGKAYYVNVSRSITDQECNMKWNTFQGEVEGYNRCKNANISLIYQINLRRSLQNGTIASSIPDAKLVRISLDDETQGAGIHLNDKLNSMFIASKGVPFFEEGPEAEWVTSAIARNYDFNFTTDNDKAKVLRTIPISNLNANYNHRESSTFQIGVSSGAEIDKSGPKIKADVNIGWMESKWLTFDTRDYRVELTNDGGRNVGFKWARQEYRNAESIKNLSIHGSTADLRIPADLSRINPIAYANFKPRLEVIYKASPTETGTTKITIDSAVDITGFRYRSSISWPSIRTYYAKDSDNQTSRVSKKETIIVDWDHPVFTGGRPVNLQLAHFNNKCISADNKQNVTIQTCEESSHQQAFIYSRRGQYVSARNTDLCLDAENLSHLQICNLRGSQRWEWKEGTEQLQNKRYKTYLGHNKTTGKLSLISDEDSDTSIELYTSYVDVFH